MKGYKKKKTCIKAFAAAGYPPELYAKWDIYEMNEEYELVAAYLGWEYTHGTSK